ncbi:MAG: hypothetical protein ACFFCS_13015 [Candidatus Hodarchaeota archaeon]
MDGKKNARLIVILEIIILFVGFFSISQLSLGLNDPYGGIGFTFTAPGFFQVGACIMISILVIPGCVIYLSQTKMIETGKRFHTVRMLSLVGFLLSIGIVVPQLLFAGVATAETQPDQVGVYLLFMLIFLVLAVFHFVIFYLSAKVIKAGKETERS